jgi:hypothetical protein
MERFLEGADDPAWGGMEPKAARRELVKPTQVFDTGACWRRGR